MCLIDKTNGTAVDTYRLTSCLPRMWELFVGIMCDYLYNFLEEKKLLPEEHKVCRRKTRRTKEQLLINKEALKGSERRYTNLAMAWVDY